MRFSENLHYNIDLIKFFVPSSELVTEGFLIGNAAPREVTLIYLEKVANDGIIKEIRKRVKAIKTRTLFDSSYIQRNIEDSGLSPFPQVEITSRPDVVQSALWQGRVCNYLGWQSRCSDSALYLF